MMAERIYTIPLKTKKTAKNKRARKAVLEVKKFLRKHMKGEKILLKKELNQMLWSRGIKKPPSKIKIRTEKKEGIIRAQLKDYPLEEKKPGKEPEAPVKEETKKVAIGKTGGAKKPSTTKGKTKQKKTTKKVPEKTSRPNKTAKTSSSKKPPKPTAKKPPKPKKSAKKPSAKISKKEKQRKKSKSQQKPKKGEKTSQKPKKK